MEYRGVLEQQTSTGTSTNEVERLAQGFALPLRWQLDRLIGKGGQAEVWLARDMELDEWVAIKVFPADLNEVQRERLRREVKLGRQLAHVNLVKVYELIDGGDRLAVAMEWVPQGSLKTRLAQGPCRVEEVIAIAQQVLDALSFLHEKNIVHRDVKPSNLLIDSDGRIRLADLGMARLLVSGSDLTRTEVAVGTPGYMSPEQYRGDKIGPQSDLYSFGVTLFELLTGCQPGNGKKGASPSRSKKNRISSDPRIRRSDCPDWLARFVMRLLEFEPGRRFQDAGAASQALQKRRIWIKPRVGLVWIVVLAAGVLLLLAFVTFSLISKNLKISAEIIASELVVKNQQGIELWRKVVGNAPIGPVIGDFLGESAPQVAVGLQYTGNTHDAGAKDIVLFSAQGNERMTLSSTSSTEMTSIFPDFTPTVGGPSLFSVSLGRTSRPALGWVVNHSLWYPSCVGVWNPALGLTPGTIFVNSGHLNPPTIADVDGDGQDELIFTGINNPIGYQAVLIILKPSRLADQGLKYVEGYSPDLLAEWQQNGPLIDSPLMLYLPLGTYRGTPRIVAASEKGITLQIGSELLEFDNAGNPSGSPLFASGSDRRKGFWNHLVLTCLDIEVGKVEAKGAIASLREGGALVLRESPMRLATDLLLARSLARAGKGEEAIHLLREAVGRDIDQHDLWLRLGEQLGISGHYREAADALSEAIRPRPAGRSGIDAMNDLLLLAAVNDDRAMLSDILGKSRNLGVRVQPETASVLEVPGAFCRGDWNNPALVAVNEISAQIVPVALLLSAWARFESGGDATAAKRDLERLGQVFEVRDLVMLFHARIATKDGRSQEAVNHAERALEHLGKKGLTSVEAWCWIPLAHRVLADAYAAQGEWDKASLHYRRAAEIAPECWFGKTPSQ